MLQRNGRVAGLVEPCLPSPAKTPPSGPDWLHEIKHDGFRILARREADHHLGTTQMSRSKLRRITISDQVYLWRLDWSYRKSSGVGIYETLYQLICYRDGFQHSPAIIHFTTWEDALTGGPLHTGVPLDLNMPNGSRVNLNRPATIGKIIRYLKSAGWHPEVDSGKLEIQDGQMLSRIFEAGRQSD